MQAECIIKRNTVFRRTNREIELGLTKEQCIELRAGAPPAKVVKVKIKKAKRFRRTAEEIRLDLTIAQAAAARGVVIPKKKHHVLKPVAVPAVVGQTVVDTLMEALPPRTQARARAVQRYRMGGGKAVLTKDTLDQIEMFTKTGRVKKLPPCVDSTGFNHLTGAANPAEQEAA